jgi:MOSC domain-containing protein YiiM
VLQSEDVAPVVLRLLSVNVAQPSVLLEYSGGEVVSSLDKRPVTQNRLYLSEANLEGDAQADMRMTPAGQPVHGGEHQAVYAFPVEHHPRLEEILGSRPWFGYMGENLSVEGATEEEVCVGDIWTWGEARLQVSAPRGPCYKLGIRMGKQASRTVIRQEGLVGWYLRVLTPGGVPTAGELTLESRDSAGLSVGAVHRALQDRDHTYPEMAAHPALSPNLSRALLARGRDLSGGVSRAGLIETPPGRPGGGRSPTPEARG